MDNDDDDINNKSSQLKTSLLDDTLVSNNNNNHHHHSRSSSIDEITLRSIIGINNNSNHNHNHNHGLLPITTTTTTNNNNNIRERRESSIYINSEQRNNRYNKNNNNNNNRYNQYYHKYCYLPTIPSLSWLKTYNMNTFQWDLYAGISVGLMLIPQGMAYASLAGLPPIYGLYTGTLPPLAYAIFGTSSQLTVGPVALVSIFIPKVMKNLHLSDDDYQNPEKLAMISSLIALICSICFFIMGILRLGGLMKFISHSVMTGFTTAAAIVIGIGQLKHILGFKIPDFDYQYQEIIYIFSHFFSETQMIPLIYGVLSIGFLLICKIYKSKYVNNNNDNDNNNNNNNITWKLIKLICDFSILVVVVMTSIISFISYKWFDYDQDILHIVGDIEKGGFRLEVPTIKDFAELQTIVIGCIPVIIVAYMESYAVARKYALLNRYDIDANQELIALAYANLLGSMSRSYPAAGSFGRTAVNAQAGSKTPMSNVIVSIFMILSLFLLTPLFYYIPYTALGAIIEMALLNLIDFTEFQKAYHCAKSDFIVMMATFIFTVLLNIDTGLFIGIGISFIILLQALAEVETTVLGEIPGQYRYGSLYQYPHAIENSRIKVIRLNGSLYFGNSTEMKTQVISILNRYKKELSHVVIDAGGVAHFDLSVSEAFEDIFEQAKLMNIQISLANVSKALKSKLELNHLWTLMGEENACLELEDVIAELNSNSNGEVSVNGYISTDNEELPLLVPN